MTTTVRDMPAALAASTTWRTIGLPATLWTSFENCDSILFPRPAARIMAHTSRLRGARAGRRAGRRSSVGTGAVEEVTGRNVCVTGVGRAGAPEWAAGWARPGPTAGGASAAPGPLPRVTGSAGLRLGVPGRATTGPVRAAGGRLDVSTIGVEPRGTNRAGAVE